jgi:hypothetical protein
MPSHTDERRRAPRLPASGRVEILFEDPLPASVEAELVDTSARGFRISHESSRLVPGLEVRLQRDGPVRRARVIWTHILDGRSVSGCLLL